MNTEIKVKHFRGYMTCNNMNEEWLIHWKKEALEANASGKNLYIVELPDNYPVSRMEELLQNDIKSPTK